MRRWLIALAAMCGTVAAQMPLIIGHIPTQGGKIVMGSEPCDNSSSRYAGYLQNTNGKIVQPLCWEMVDDQIFVAYSDGDLYTYPVGAVRFSAAFDEWYKNRENRT